MPIIDIYPLTGRDRLTVLGLIAALLLLALFVFVGAGVIAIWAAGQL